MKTEIEFTRRRTLHTLTAAAAAATVPWPSWAADMDSRVSRIVHDTIGIDCHNHVDVQLDSAGTPSPDLDLGGEIKRAGLSAICMSFAVDYKKLLPGEAHTRFLAGLTVMDAQLRRNGMNRALGLADLRRAHAAHRPIVIQAVEGAHFVEDKIERLEEAHARGLRHLGLLHDSDAAPPLGDVYTNPVRFNGLSPLGREVVQAANRLGMLVDLAHGSANTVRAALTHSTSPILISHTGLDSQTGANPMIARAMGPRLINADLARTVASGGGVIGVWTRLSSSPDNYAANIRALVDIAGIDHVCIGTDLKLTPPFPQGYLPSPGATLTAGPAGAARSVGRAGGRTNGAWSSQSAGFYYVVVEALLRAGFTSGDIRKVGGENYCRVFDAATR